MKAKLQDEYLPPYFQEKYLPQSYYGNSQGQQGNTRYWSSQPIAPFKENTTNVCSISNPQPTQAPSFMAQTLKNLEQAIQNTSAELQRIHTRLVSSEVSHIEDVASSMFVQEEEPIVELKQGDLSEPCVIIQPAQAPNILPPKIFTILDDEKVLL